jgi:cysteine desulfurase
MTLYFDHAASTPVAPEVAAAMASVLADPALQANPAADHPPGRAALAVVDAAQAAVATLVGALAGEIVFTSGATESNNLAVLGAARWRRARGRHVITAATEHASVVAPCRQLEREGFEVTWLRPGPDGVIVPAQVAAVIRPDTVLVSLMQVNNEIGVVQDVAALGRLCRSADAWLHVDAVQAAGREIVDVRAAQVDLLSVSAHKIGGPKGVGALVLDESRVQRLDYLHHGGGQQRGLRPGTLPTHQLAGFGVAADLARAGLTTEAARLTALRDQLCAALTAVPGVRLNGQGARRAPHIVSVSVPGVEGESLRLALEGLAVSAGAACDAGHGEPSAVLRCLGHSGELARSTVRFSLGRGTTAAEVDAAVRLFAVGVAHARRLAPAA